MKKKPLIGMNPAVRMEQGKYLYYSLDAGYGDGVVAAGGEAMMLTHVEKKADLVKMVQTCDGFIFTGGPDYHPSAWGERPHTAMLRMHPQRHRFDLALAKEVLRSGKPVLGICCGCQLINIAAGGTLYQDMFSHKDFKDGILHKKPRKKRVHTIEVSPGTRLSKIVGAGTKWVNSCHHQALKKLGKNLIMSSCSKDGCIETIESRDPDHFVLGVQWHPEEIYKEPMQLALFKALVKAAGQ